MKQNLVVLLADLFNLFEIHPAKCVAYPGMDQQMSSELHWNTQTNCYTYAIRFSFKKILWGMLLYRIYQQTGIDVADLNPK